MIEAWLWRLAARFMPSTDTRWILAMRGEAEGLPATQRLVWVFGALATALRLSATTSDTLLAGSLIGAMVTIEWLSGDALPALVLIGTTATILVRRAPHRVWEATLIAGGALPFAHAIANFVPPLWPHYQFERLGLYEWATLCSLLVPAFASAWLAKRSWCQRWITS